MAPGHLSFVIAISTVIAWVGLSAQKTSKLSTGCSCMRAGALPVLSISSTHYVLVHGMCSIKIYELIGCSRPSDFVFVFFVFFSKFASLYVKEVFSV